MRKLIVVLVLVAVALAGCVGSGGRTQQQPSSDAGDADDAAGTGSEQPTDEGPDETEDAPGDGSQAAAKEDEPRVPVDALDVEPAQTGEGWARFDLEGTSDFAFNTYSFDTGACSSTAGGQPLPVGNRCNDVYNLTLQGDETRVEAVLTWESEMTDLHMYFLDDNGKKVEDSTHGQVFINDVCATAASDCLYFFPPNASTWEYLRLTDDILGAGEWGLEVDDRNNWDSAHASTLAGGEGPAYQLSVWVHTVPPTETHHPGEG